MRACLVVSTEIDRLGWARRLRIDSWLRLVRRRLAALRVAFRLDDGSIPLDLVVRFLWLCERAAFVLRIAFKLYRFNFTSSGLEANGPWKYDLKIVLVCVVVIITFSLDACFGLGFHFLLSLLFDKSFFLDDGSCDFLLNWKLFLSTFELVNVLAYREVSSQGKEGIYFLRSSKLKELLTAQFIQRTFMQWFWYDRWGYSGGKRGRGRGRRGWRRGSRDNEHIL